ncbi:MAG: Flp pilus assembly protein CpaB [Dehalococcoidia bacterium]
MSSIAANANSERTNRWLLIAGVALALVTGILVFAAVSSMSGDDAPASSAAATGDSPVLVAKETIRQGSKLEADQFRVATFAEADLVPSAIDNPETIVGQTATTDILKGQQLSRSHIAAATDDDRADQLTFKVPDGHRGVGVAVNDVSTFGGLVVPGDRVDIIVTYEEKEGNFTDAPTYKRISTVLQNVLVLAREQTDIQRVDPLPGEEDTAAGEEPAVAGGEAFEQRPEDFEPDGGVSVVTLALTPADVQSFILADSLGEVTLVLRKFGEDSIVPIEDVRQLIYE